MMRRGIQRLAVAAPSSWPRGDDRPAKEKLYPVGSKTNGFVVDRVTPIEELRLTVFHFRHERTGSKVYHLDCNDQNNAFCLGFGTPATSSRGTTHVLEHTVLCGSDRYPVKDPFFHMIRRSLSTFMNAMTGADYTLYPFATMNPADYQNLLDVYLDAVFRPKLSADDFRQEAHRLEPVEASADDASNASGLKFNGVVFNEMLGVVSEPPRYFMQALQKAQLPGTHYEHLSGGSPPEVLDLTHQEVMDYHKTHYNPWNAVAMTYGDLDPAPTLAKIDEYYQKQDAATTETSAKQRVKIPELRQWRKAPVTQEEAGPASVLGDPEHQSKCIVSYAVPPSSGASNLRMDRDTLVNLTIADTLLTDGPASPMYRALVTEGKLGESFAPMTGFQWHYTTPLLSYGVDQVVRSEADPAKVEKVVEETLAAVIQDGFDHRRVQSTVFQTELSQRHRGASYGVNTCIGLAAMWHVTDADPDAFLNWMPALREIEAKPAVLQEALKEATRTNGHRLTLTMHADPKHASKLEAEVKEKLDKKNQLHAAAVASDPSLDAAFRADHKAWLERVHAPQDATVLPTLAVSDISKTILQEPPMRATADGVEIIETEANGLVYVSLLIPYADDFLLPSNFGFGTAPGAADEETVERHQLWPMFGGLATGLGTSKFDFEQFDVEAQLVASSIGFGSSLEQRFERPSEFIGGTTSGFYTTVEKLPAALDLLAHTLDAPRQADALTAKDRAHLKTALITRATSKAEGLQRNGHRVASMLSYATRSFGSSLSNVWYGLHQARVMDRISRVLTSDDAAASEAMLDRVIRHRDTYLNDLRFRANSLGADVWAACDARNQATVTGHLKSFRERITQQSKTVNSEPRVLSSAALTEVVPDVSSTVQNVELPINACYAAKSFHHGYDFASKENQSLRVALQLLSSEHLHKEVRELGGAYGCMTEASLGGVGGGVCIASYRDPQPDKSLATFDTCGSWLADKGNVTAERVDQAKMRLFSSLDRPITCASYGMKRRLNGLSPETQQQMRDALLSVTAEDIVGTAAAAFQAPQTAAVLRPKKADE